MVLTGLTSAHLPDENRSNQHIEIRLNGPDFGPPSRPPLSEAFIHAAFRGKNGGLGIFTSPQSEIRA
ncbi:MAG: hypothetical protein KDF59_03045, partial [Nitrosomonas sp.]|nr:hypothetical protein [Nitrosomonas sp.]